MEEPRDGIDQYIIGGSGAETAGLFEGQHPFDPAVALSTRRAVRALPPEDAKPQGPFRPVVRRLDPMLPQKDPQGVHLPQQAPGKPSSVIGAVMILLDQLAEARVPGTPLPPRGWGFGHRTETPQLRQRPGATGSELWTLPLGQAPCRADEVRQTRLPRRDPGLVHPIAITDQDTCPVVNQGSEGLLRPVGMDHGESHGVADHHPQPVQGVREQPGRFIAVVDARTARVRGNGSVMRLDGLRDPVQHFLDGSQADGHAQH